MKTKQYTNKEKVDYYTKQIHNIAHNAIESEDAYEMIYWIRQAYLKAIRVERILSKDFLNILEQEKSKASRKQAPK